MTSSLQAEVSRPPKRPETRHALWAFVALLVLFAAVSVSLLSTSIDDAFISFRYLDNWLRGDGLVFNPGEHVEGYSSFLWIALLAVPALFGAGPQYAAPEIEWFLALGCLVLLTIGAKHATRRSNSFFLAASLLLAFNSSFFFWIGKGMEVVFYTALQLGFAVAVLAVQRKNAMRWRDAVGLGAIAAAAALTRPEGVVAPAMVLATLAAVNKGRRRFHLLALAILAAAVAGQFAFRLAYYGLLWPNTYYAKRLPPATALAAGLDYLRQFLAGQTEREAWFYASSWASHLPVWVVCAIAGAFAAKQWRRLWPVALQMASLAAVAVYVGGDWMPAFRFLVPAIPLGCLLVGAGLSEMAGDAGVHGQVAHGQDAHATLLRRRRIAAWGLLAALAAVECVGLVAMIRSHEFRRWRHQIRNYGPMAAWLEKNARVGSLVALSDIGIIAYRNPQLRFMDVLGLTDPHIASLPGVHYLKTDMDYVLRRQPDYVLVMLFEWPKLKRIRPKTTFDEAFLAHVAKQQDYVRVANVFGWEEGLRGGRRVWFEVYARTVFYLAD